MSVGAPTIEAVPLRYIWTQGVSLNSKRKRRPVTADFLRGLVMFTGIVATTGIITHLQPLEQGLRLTVEASGLNLKDVALGDSVAHSGVCLTVIAKKKNSYQVDVSKETLDCTVGLNVLGSEVNLEKAMRLTDFIGGHLVSGHVDGVGEVVKFDKIGESHELVIKAPKKLAKYVARKGSITVDGVSLTTNTVKGRTFSINLIPHTVEVTTLKRLHPDATVNLEVDLIARYCERLLAKK